MTRLRSVLLSMPPGVGYRLARGLGVLDPGAVAPGAVVVAPTLSGPVPFAPPDAEVPSAVADLPDKGFSRRLRVRAPGDVWSDEFRQELRRDRAFEASLIWRQAAVLFVIAVVIAVRIVGS